MAHSLKGSGRMAGFGGCLLVFAVLWTAFSLFWMIAAWMTGAGLFALFGVPFVAIGVGLLCWGVKPIVVRMKLDAPTITLSRDAIRIGDAFTAVHQQVVKQAIDVPRLSADFIFRESATYQQGTDTTTVTHDVPIRQYDQIGRRYEPGEVIRHEYALEIPADGMHSFSATKNQLKWLLKVRVEITGWPDFHEEYEVRVLPERAG